MFLGSEYCLPILKVFQTCSKGQTHCFPGDLPDRECRIQRRKVRQDYAKMLIRDKKWYGELQAAPHTIPKTTAHTINPNHYVRCLHNIPSTV